MIEQTAVDYSRKITQASPTGLVVITYELIIKNLSEANSLVTTDEILYHQRMSTAKNLISELIGALKLEYAISGELLQLYLFMNRRLIQADIRKDVSELPRIIGMLTSLKEAFAEVASEDHSGPVMENAQTVYAGLTYSKGSLNESLSGDPNRGYKV